MSNPLPEVMTPEQVAEFLQVPLTWLYEKSRRRQRNPLPVHRIGRYLRYTREEVMTWFADQTPRRRKGQNEVR
jgi:predicted DNA-binding transcriptional regulator AlpA